MTPHLPPRPARRGARLRGSAAVAVLALIAACAGDDAASTVDSSLARDLALANVIAQPQFNDAPLEQTPEPTPPPSNSAGEAPRPTTSEGTARPAPRPTSTRPAPRPRPTQPRTPAPEREETPQPAPAPAPAPAERAGFAAGTRLALATGAKVCTVTGRVGDKLTARLREPVEGAGGARIPAGTTVVLEVASVEPADPAESGRITFRVRSLDIDERAHPATGSGSVSGGLERVAMQKAGTSDKKRVAGGAILGAIAGAIIEGGAKGAVIGAAAGGTAGAVSAKMNQEHDGCLPAGSPVTIVLDERVTLG